MHEANKCCAVITSVGLHKPTLEDVFLKYTGRKIREPGRRQFDGDHDDAQEARIDEKRSLCHLQHLASGDAALLPAEEPPLWVHRLALLLPGVSGNGIWQGTSLPGIPSGIGYVSFLTPGIIGMTLLFSATFAGLSVLWDREFGFLKEIMVCPGEQNCHRTGTNSRRPDYGNPPG